MLPARSSPQSLPGKMSMTLVPMELMSLITFCRAPWPSATTETTAVMPMMIPSMVSRVRIRWDAMAISAMVKASAKRPMAS